jgi:NAD(P)-dependent dehydrogenase (short-subunit alcohol dehydrogenase family)
MAAQGYGRIVNISSVTGPVVTIDGSSAYATAKAAITGMTRSIALDYGRHGITCNAVLPGAILTDINRSLLQPGQPLLAHLSSRIPLGRIGEATDIADVIAFLCSDESRYMNGSEVLIDGGMFVNLL